MQIGVCIKYFHPNYGGMLQSYATIELLHKKGIKIDLIRYQKKKNFVFVLKSLPRLFNPILLNDKYLMLSKKVNSKLHPEFGKNEKDRKEKFREFEIEQFSNYERKCIGYDELKKCTGDYDAILTGSDQLWSPSGLETNFFNLMFVPESIKKISLASSFGVSALPKNQLKRTRMYLQRIEYISVREKKGAEIVYDLTGRDVPVILDPVFMLGTNDWNRIATSCSLCQERYVFAYLLGACSEYRDEVESFAREKGLKIITLRHANQYVQRDEYFGDSYPYAIGPREFLSLIKGAEYVFTDSYHGCVFSVLYHKQFVVFNRYADHSVNSKNSRIDTLCESFHLSDRRFAGKGTLSKTADLQIDYREADRILQKKRAEFNDYLDSALSD